MALAIPGKSLGFNRDQRMFGCGQPDRGCGDAIKGQKICLRLGNISWLFKFPSEDIPKFT